MGHTRVLRREPAAVGSRVSGLTFHLHAGALHGLRHVALETQLPHQENGGADRPDLTGRGNNERKEGRDVRQSAQCPPRARARSAQAAAPAAAFGCRYFVAESDSTPLLTAYGPEDPHGGDALGPL